MNLQHQIDEIFEGKAFDRPLYYAYPGGLRFGLSEAGTYIEQFLIALHKARSICADLFPDEGSLLVCLRVYSRANPFAHRPVLAALRDAGIRIPEDRVQWSEAVPEDDRVTDDQAEYWVNIAFRPPLSLLQNLLWCALAKDFGNIQPRPLCDIYLFNPGLRVVAFPYDDRGMDVVGPNRAVLRHLYQKHQQYLLDYDRPEMDEVHRQRHEETSSL